MDEARTQLDRMLAVLEEHLGGRDYLLGVRFTIADLNLASILALYKFIGASPADLLDPFPRANAWLNDRCLSRSACKKVMAMEASPADLPHLHSASS